MALNETTCSNSKNLTSPACLISPSLNAGLPLFAQTSDYEKTYVAEEGWLTSRNASKEHGVLTMNDVDSGPGSELDGLSYVINPKSHRQDIYMASTIGLKTECKVITSSCKADEQSFNCSNVNRPELQSQVTGSSQNVPFNNLASALYLIDSSNNYVGSSSTVAASSNPFKLSVLMSFSLPGGGSMKDLKKDGFVSYQVGPSTYAYSLAECSLTFKDLNLDYFNSTYSIAQDDGIKNSSSSIAHALSGPVLAGLVTSLALDPLGKLIGRVGKEEFETTLSNDLSQNVLAMASGLLQSTNVEVRSWEDILASQYDKLPLYIYLGLLYIYAAVAVFLFL